MILSRKINHPTRGKYFPGLLVEETWVYLTGLLIMPTFYYEIWSMNHL
jgi:hypothetical protein